MADIALKRAADHALPVERYREEDGPRGGAPLTEARNLRERCGHRTTRRLSRRFSRVKSAHLRSSSSGISSDFSTSFIARLAIAKRPKISSKRSSFACIAICTGSIAERSSRPGCTRLRPTWRRTSCGTGPAIRSCSFRRSRRIGTTRIDPSSSRTRVHVLTICTGNGHLRELVEASVARLPEHHWQVFVLRELEGKSYEEIAEITACNLGTVKSRLNRARTSFAEIIGPGLR